MYVTCTIYVFSSQNCLHAYMNILLASIADCSVRVLFGQFTSYDLQILNLKAHNFIADAQLATITW